jgi:general secretion pathway protein E
VSPGLANPDAAAPDASSTGDRSDGDLSNTAADAPSQEAASESAAAGAPSPEFLSLIPHDFARRHLIFSRGVVSNGERLEVGPGTSPAAVFNTGVRLGRAVAAHPGDPEAIAAAIDRAYATHVAEPPASSSADQDAPPVAVEGSTDIEADLRAILGRADADLLHTSGKAPVIRLVDLLIFEAIQRRASDIHVQPLADRALVRYRLDGVLHTVRELPVAMAAPVISRVKVMARLDVAEQRAPQDGRATVTLGGADRAAAARRIDLRISTLPTTYGERIVIRLLDTAKTPHLLRFAALGMPKDVEQPFLAQASRSSGIVLVTGPTGSGKTTTLYTTLAWITTNRSGASASGCGMNVMTIEDPVEYDLSAGGGAGLAISQTQLNSKKGVTFAAGLRHILRQDPDVIMVGEIRDEETARIAVQASLTGHLVFSTLHTNDAASAIARLLDLDVEPFLVSSSLAAVLAQRLVRRVHPPCRGAGCGDCLTTGYQGRTGVFELLVVDEALREQISRRAPASTIKQLAVAGGMCTLAAAGAAMVRAGITSQAELTRVIEGFE